MNVKSFDDIALGDSADHTAVVDADVISAYAVLTGDHNPIHEGRRLRGGHQVLLDGEVPVWGSWQADDPHGHRVFEVNKTQTLPGLEPPSQAPPPGYTLTAAESSTSQAQPAEDKGSSTWIWIAVGVGTALVGALAVGLVLLRSRKTSS